MLLFTFTLISACSPRNIFIDLPIKLVSAYRHLALFWISLASKQILDISCNKSYFLSHLYFKFVIIYIARYIVLFFRLFTFPTKATEQSRVDRLNWTFLINWQEKHNPNQLWKAKNQSRVFSLQFLDQKPTNSNPYPTLSLGYDSESKVRRIVLSRKKIKISRVWCSYYQWIIRTFNSRWWWRIKIKKNFSKETSLIAVAKSCCFFKELFSWLFSLLFCVIIDLYWFC